MPVAPHAVDLNNEGLASGYRTAAAARGQGGCQKDPRGTGMPYPSLWIRLGSALDASRSHRGGVMPATVMEGRRHRPNRMGWDEKH
jgi:hypothetical protein